MFVVEESYRARLQVTCYGFSEERAFLGTKVIGGKNGYKKYLLIFLRITYLKPAANFLYLFSKISLK
jgi:hypothetical protein